MHDHLLPPTTAHHKNRQAIDLLGISIDVLDTATLCDRVHTFSTGKTQKTIMYVNADCILLSRKNRQYRQAINTADLVYADGFGVILGARLFNCHLPGRSTAADFFTDFCKTCAANGTRLFFLGAKDGVAQNAAKRLQESIPGLLIVGTHHGYFSVDETSEIIARINQTRPDIIIFGLGAPRQELWMKKHGPSLAAPVLWGVGGLFDFLSGNTPRGPQWMLDHGFEWLCRLAVEPVRLWRRYLIGNAHFLCLLISHRFLFREHRK